ncbi:MAG: DUF1570 domain-containing protein [Phycisphaeraceae bacterium]|nr:MAG: DUF1570 domain-containing protein [Phycisphaeraceae bacterium]
MRTWVLLLGVLALVVTQAMRMPASARGDASTGGMIALGAFEEEPPPASARRSVDDLLVLADQTREAGDLRGADALLRQAIALDRRDPRAATTLRAMYQTPGVSLPVDQEAVSELQARLGPTFRATQTRHFVVLSDSDPAWTRSREAMLERTYRQVFRFADRLGMSVHVPEAKLICVLVDDYDTYRSFAGKHDAVSAHWMAGYYTATGNRVVFYNDRTGPQFREAESVLRGYEADARRAREESVLAHRRRDRDAVAAYAARADLIEEHVASERGRIAAAAEAMSTAKTIHEAAHLVAFNIGLQLRTHQYPFWLTEGLATNFESETGEGAFGPDTSVEQREEELRRAMGEGRLLPLREFVQMTHVPHDSEEAAGAMYPQAYSLFQHAARYDRGALRGLFEDLNEEPGGTIAPCRLLALFERHFGDVDVYERRWLRRIEQAR